MYTYENITRNPFPYMLTQKCNKKVKGYSKHRDKTKIEIF